MTSKVASLTDPFVGSNSKFSAGVAVRHGKIHTLDDLPNGSITDKLALIEAQLVSAQNMIASNAQQLTALHSNLDTTAVQVQSAEEAQGKINDDVRCLNEKVVLTYQSHQNAKAGVWQAAQTVGGFLMRVPSMQTQPVTPNTQSAEPASQEENANEARNVILCSGHKVHRSDLERMQNQILATERQLQAAEAAVKQAEEAYNAVWAKAVDHVVPSVDYSGGPNVSINVGIKGLGTYLAYDGPNLDAARAIRNKAHTDYNYTLLKFGQEKALYGHMQRAYDSERSPGSDGSFSFKGFFFGFFGGLFGVGVSKNF